MDICELQKRALEGDKQAENLLFQILTARFRLFAKRSIWNDDDCREIVQETVVTILDKYKTIDFSTSFIGWAHNVLRNKILNFVTKTQRQSSLMASTYHGDNDHLACGTDVEFETKLLDCLGRISKKNNQFARVINLSYQGFTAQEICERLKTSVNNIYSTLSRARSLLMYCLEKGDIR